MSRAEQPHTIERLRAIAVDECIHDQLDVSTVEWAVEEIERLRGNWADLQQRIERARETLRTPESSPRMISKSQGLNVALDYMRGYGPSEPPRWVSA